jgi:hypothetical protein
MLPEQPIRPDLSGEAKRILENQQLNLVMDKCRSLYD